jgi:uncharacterized protein (DUF58 family)
VAGLRGPWQPTRAVRRAVGLSCLFLVVGAVLGRPDLVAMGSPLAVGLLLALSRRPTTAPEVSLEVPASLLVEGQVTTAEVAIATDFPLDVATVSVDTDPWLGVVGGRTRRTLALPAGGESVLDVRLRALRWGRHTAGPVWLLAYACDGMLVCTPQHAPAVPVDVTPLYEPFAATELVPKATGIVGVHRSRRPGEGGELAGVRPFQLGDRLRRIDWRVTLRTREMHVTATLSDRDTDIVVLLDSLHEVGVSGGILGRPSSLDTAVRAAAAVAEFYLSRGDRVSMVDYGGRTRFVPARTGRTHLRRILDWLLDTEVFPEAADAGPRMLGARVLPPNALTVVLTPLVDDRVLRILATLAQHGRSMVAVDTLDPEARPDRVGVWQDAAYRLWRMRREADIQRLRDAGVPVVAWAGAGSLDAVLRDVTRMASAARAVAR